MFAVVCLEVIAPFLVAAKVDVTPKVDYYAREGVWDLLVDSWIFPDWKTWAEFWPPSSQMIFVGEQKASDFRDYDKEPSLGACGKINLHGF